MADVKYIITVDAATAAQSIQKFDAAVKEMGATAVLAGGQHESLWKSMALGQVAANLAMQGFQVLKREFLDSIKQAADYEKALKGLNSAFSISGRTMPGMVDNLRRYAGELEKLGLAEDDAILRAESLIMQFSTLDEKGIKLATRGALGLASVFGTDLASAAETVTKGMEGNYTMLGRLIPAIRNATTEEEKRAAMMRTFEDLYKRAIADTETYAGQVQKLGLEWKNAKQDLGTTVLETGILQEAMHGLMLAVRAFSGAWRRDYVAALGEQTEANNKAGASLNKMAGALGWNRAMLPGLREQYHLNSVQLLSWIQDNMLGTKASAALKVVLDEEAAALAKTKAGFTETGTAAKPAAVQVKLLATAIDSVNWGRHLPAFKALQDWLAGISTTIVADTLPAIAGYSHAVDKAADRTKIIGAALDWLNKKKPTFAEKWTAAMDKVMQGAEAVFAGTEAIATQKQKNAEIAIDNEYKKRLDYINATVKDEDQKQKAIMALDAEYDIKRRAAQHAAAKQQKAFSIAQAIINVAEGMTKALAQGGIFGPILAAVVAAFGAIQIAAIVAQPIPLAKGFEGMVTKPTMFLAGEAGPEYLSVRPKSKGGGGYSMTVNSPLIVTSAALTEDMCRRAARWMFAAVDGEARRHGGRLQWQT